MLYVETKIPHTTEINKINMGNIGIEMDHNIYKQSRTLNHHSL